MSIKAIAGAEPVQVYAAPAYGAEGKTFRITNLDLANTVHFDTQPTVTASSSPLPQQASAGFDGSQDVWMSVLGGPAVLVDVATSATDYQNPVGVAVAVSALGLATSALQTSQETAIPNNIAVTGTPLLHGYNPITSPYPESIALAASGSFFPVFPIAKPGYIVQITAQYTSTSGAKPFVEIEMEWQDQASGTRIAQENWYVPVSASGSSFKVYGKGPTKGNQLTVGVKNLDPAQGVTVTFALSETTQHITRDDWRSDTPNNVPGFTTASCDPLALSLEADSILVAATSQAVRLLPLYSGQAQLFYTVPTGITSGTIEIDNLNPNLTSPALFRQAITAAGNFGPFNIDIPRCPCQMNINNGSASSGTFGASLIAIEYAS